MSGFAFSHQFSKRWLATPTPVKHAIIQELDDIVTLLQPDTDLDNYQFSVPNLHDKVEELLAIERAHQEKLQAEERQRQLEEQQRLEAQRLEAQKLEAQRKAAEKLEAERLAQEKLAAQELDAQHLQEVRFEKEPLAQAQSEQVPLDQEQFERQQAERDRQAQDEAAIAALEQERAIAKQANLTKQAPVPPSHLAQQAIQSSTSSITFASEDEPSNVTIERHSSDMVYAIDDSALPQATIASNVDAPIETSNAESEMTTSPDIQAIKQAIIQQLQGYIDHYLLESMTLMNEDLNKWLTTEVEKQVQARLAQSESVKF